jgi:hypothetical protein
MVNVGQIVAGSDSVASAAAQTIRPPVGEEWQVNNIYFGAGVTLKISDGTNETAFETISGQGALLKYTFNLTNTHFLKVYNDDAASQVIQYDGRRTA